MFFGMNFDGNEKTGKNTDVVIVSTVCSELTLDIKNSFWEFLKKLVGR